MIEPWKGRRDVLFPWADACGRAWASDSRTPTNQAGTRPSPHGLLAGLLALLASCAVGASFCLVVHG
jgi:hypothetical protein